MSISVAVATTLPPDLRPNQLYYERVLGPTVLPYGPGAGRRGVIVMLGASYATPIQDLVEQLWDRNVSNVLFTGALTAAQDALTQQQAINSLTDKLLDRAERHSRHLEFELETAATRAPIGSLRLNIARFVITPRLKDTVFEHVWALLRTERAVIRLRCQDMEEVAEVDRWMLALAANPDGELTRSDHRIRARRRWLDVRTWVELGSLDLLPAILERRWHLSPNLLPLTLGES